MTTDNIRTMKKDLKLVKKGGRFKAPDVVFKTAPAKIAQPTPAPKHLDIAAPAAPPPKPMANPARPAQPASPQLPKPASAPAPISSAPPAPRPAPVAEKPTQAFVAPKPKVSAPPVNIPKESTKNPDEYRPIHIKPTQEVAEKPAAPQPATPTSDKRKKFMDDIDAWVAQSKG